MTPVSFKKFTSQDISFEGSYFHSRVEGRGRGYG